MATYIAYTPTGIIAKALFNFDAFGLENFKYEGTVNLSVSDSFTLAQYQSSFPYLSSDVYTSLTSGNANWTADQLANIALIASTYSNFIGLAFSPVANQSGLSPAMVGASSDINISLVYRKDEEFSGESALNDDLDFGYANARGDVFVNIDGLGSRGLNNNYSLGSNTFGFHVLMHEIGHSLGLAHPHSSIDGGTTLLTSDFAATASVGFEKLGFHINGALDMNKEYFSIMSYDDQSPAGAPDTFAQTPMILDVIALQAAYGEGGGSSGNGNDVIEVGGSGGVSSFRTYFDTGGRDTIDLVNYTGGAYLHMGTTIVGATQLVGVSMSAADANAMINQGGDPASLRWFYGEFEDACGGVGADVLIGNPLNNTLKGMAGNDTLDGGAGLDTASFRGALANYALNKTADGFSITDRSIVLDGVDTLQGIERLSFTDGRIALDLGITEAAGQTELLLGAVLGRDLLATKKPLIGAVLGLFDQGNTLQQLSGALMRLDIWGALANGGNANATNTQIANYLLTTVNKVAPDAATLAAGASALNAENSITQGTFLAQLATSAANQIQVDLVGLATTGLDYTVSL